MATVPIEMLDWANSPWPGVAVLVLMLLIGIDHITFPMRMRRKRDRAAKRKGD